MVKNSVFALGWRPIGFSKRCWHLQVCVDVAEAARLVAALARFDGGGPVAGLRHGDRAGGSRLGAVVLCIDEKAQIQALDRTQPVLPLRPGVPGRRTHDYRRHGTTSLFAALNVATGKVIGKCYRRHRAVEFRRFLAVIDAAVLAEFDIHLVLDNYGKHKTAMIHEWLLRCPRFHLHFTPTSASWLNQVERWFAALTERQIRRGTHRSTTELERAIEAYLAVCNERPAPFIWTKTAAQILASLKRYCERISDTGN